MDKKPLLADVLMYMFDCNTNYVWYIRCCVLCRAITALVIYILSVLHVCLCTIHFIFVNLFIYTTVYWLLKFIVNKSIPFPMSGSVDVISSFRKFSYSVHQIEYIETSYVSTWKKVRVIWTWNLQAVLDWHLKWGQLNKRKLHSYTSLCQGR